MERCGGQPLLLTVRHKQKLLTVRMAALGLLQTEAALQVMTQEVLQSSSIEGEILNIDQVRSSIARRMGMDIAGLIPSDRNVDGVVEMMMDATQRYKESLSRERLFDWNAALFPTGRSGMQRIKGGMAR